MSTLYFWLLLRLYPEAFREEFEERLIEVFEYRSEEAARQRGFLWRTRFLGFITHDAVVSAWVERRLVNLVGVANQGKGGGM